MKTSEPAISLTDIYQPINADVGKIPGIILKILESENVLAGDVIRYFFSGKGKLLRPALTLFGARLLKSGTGLDEEENRKLLYLAASYEIFHAATLIHDDIIDSSYVRRNLPTVNVKWGAQTAVLVGDFLHDKALKTIFDSGSREIFERFLETAGTVCDGEIHELHETKNFLLSEETYLEIIDKKTAALLACCLEAGALFAGASDAQAAALKEFGRYFGLAFQIVDDCLDFTGSEHEFGKTLGADAMGGVLTLPVIRLLAEMNESERAHITGLFAEGEGSGRFQPMFDQIRQKGTLESSLQTAKTFSEKARDRLDLFEAGPARQSLDKLLDYVLERNR